MSEPVKIEEPTDTVNVADAAYINGAAELHTRVADLLDDVTVVAPSEKLPAASLSQGTLHAAPDDSPAASTSAFVAPQPSAPVLTPSGQPDTMDHVARTVLPGEPLVWSGRRSAGASPMDLPPFLQQPSAPEHKPATTEKGVHTPASEAIGPQPIAQSPALPAALVQTEQTGETFDGRSTVAATQLLNIRGRSDGVAIEIGRGAWGEVISALKERLDQSASFFRNSSVALDVGSRPVIEDELQQFADVLSKHEMRLGVVRTSSERTFQAALAVGMAVTLESSEGATVAAATTATSNIAGRGTEDGGYFVYKGYLRSGHRLRRSESILVIGDINPGAEVSSDGDVLVWGRLRGIVHAGAAGNRRALVAALDLEPTQMRIADVTTIGPDPKPGQPGRFFWRRSQHKRPEIARLVQQEIVIEEWDAARPGGFVSLRRGAG
ncbi:MAG: septum site-determining protein MinC [Caldilinea sp.]